MADTELLIEIEEHYGDYGEESIFGGGKSIRDGQDQCPLEEPMSPKHCDLVITNAVIIDYWGIVKGDIGIKDGRIVAVGKSGNPLTQSGIDPRIVIGAGTEIIAGEGKIVTAGGIDTHIHFICPQQIDVALASGITTLIGGGTGSATGTWATTCTPGAWNIMRMLQAFEGLPINVGILGKGNGSLAKPLVEMIEAGACGLKLHEDWGTTLAVIDTSLTVADEYDIQIAIHTDTLNECGFIDDSIAAIKGRAIHSFHTEGAGGGHAPDIIKIAGAAQRLALQHQPDPAVHRQHDRRASRHADGLPSPLAEHSRGRGLRRKPHPRRDDRRRGCLPRPRHHQHDELRFAGDGPDRRDDRPDLADRPQDEGAVRAAGRRQRPQRQRTSQTLRRQVHDQSGDHPRHRRPRRQHRARQAGRSRAVRAGLLRRQAVPGPQGRAARDAQMGDPNASIATPQPVYMRPQFAAYGRALSKSCLSFVSKAAIKNGVAERYGLQREVVAVENCRKIGKKDMKRNEATPEIRVDADTYQVWVDGEKVGSEPLEELPMTQRYFLF